MQMMGSEMPENSRKAHYTLRHRMIATLSQRLDGITYTQRHGLIRGMRRRGGLGFLPAIFTGSTHNTPEHRFLQSLDLSNKIVYEIGAFQGLLTLFFSSRAKEVIAYEPNPPSCERVLQNLRLNTRENVRLRQLAVGHTPGTLTLLTDPLMPGGASADPQVAGQIQASVAAITSVGVPVVTLDEDIPASNLPAPDFIKIDVEGMELPALKGMERTLRTHYPELYLEMHGATMEQKDENVRAIVRFLTDLGYGRILHVESGEWITLANATDARRGHLYCQR
jgi:FkbM family methyltransferase